LAELSILWETLSGVGDSNTSGYSDALMFEMLRGLLTRTSNLGGVSPQYLNKLAVTGAASPVSVASGAALCYGIPYSNSAAVSVTIPTPATQTRIDRIVLRASWAGKTVRITRVAGTEGAGAPSLVQTPGTTWDIPLAQVSITTGSALTVTDQREWLVGIGDGTIDSAALVNGTVANLDLVQVAADTVKGNFTGTLASVTDTSVATVLAQYINAALAKATPVAADKLALIDTAAGNVLKTLSFTDLSTSLGATTYLAFTPTMLINGVSTGITYTTQLGESWRQGTLIQFKLRLELSSKGASVGAVTLGNLPYTVNASDLTVPIETWFASTLTSASRIFFEPMQGTTLLQGRIQVGNVTTNYAPGYGGNFLQNTDIGNFTGFYLAGRYRA
jgi:hypothetical protein